MNHERSTLRERVTIRPVQPDDAAAIAALSGELGYPVDTDTMRRRLDMVASRADHAVFVACHAARVIGWIHGTIVHHVQADPRVEIGGLVVSAEARGGGVGASLVKRAEEWAIAEGIATILVRSQIMREDAHRFYEREGYTRTKTSAVFSKNL